MNEKKWSPELETLDQLLGGQIPLSVVFQFFGNADRFVISVLAMLRAGEVRLVTSNKAEVPEWQWQEALNSSENSTTQFSLEITERGSQRMG